MNPVAGGVDSKAMDAMHAACTLSAKLEWMFWSSSISLASFHCGGMPLTARASAA